MIELTVFALVFLSCSPSLGKQFGGDRNHKYVDKPSEEKCQDFLPPNGYLYEAKSNGHGIDCIFLLKVESNEHPIVFGKIFIIHLLPISHDGQDVSTPSIIPGVTSTPKRSYTKPTTTDSSERDGLFYLEIALANAQLHPKVKNRNMEASVFVNSRLETKNLTHVNTLRAELFSGIAHLCIAFNEQFNITVKKVNDEDDKGFGILSLTPAEVTRNGWNGKKHAYFTQPGSLGFIEMTLDILWDISHPCSV